MQADDYIRVVNYMKRHFHFIDSTRICIWGWSFGGYIAASALIQSDLFNCCVAVAPITDWLFVGKLNSLNHNHSFFGGRKGKIVYTNTNHILIIFGKQSML